MMDSKSFVEQIKNNILERNLLSRGDKIIVGVSGGADSVCLLKVLLEIKDEFDLSILAVHVNHGLRGDESFHDQSYVTELCNNWGISVKTFFVDIKALSKKLEISEEEAGREARYKLFGKVLKNTDADYIAVAHHLDDQAETVMHNIIRGTGLDGLCGMSMKQGKIIRPLLNIPRSQIIKYLENNNINFCTDSSNKSFDYTRNRIRNVLFPEINRLFGVDPANQLFKLSTLVSDDRDFLDQETKRAFEAIVLSDSDELVLSATGLRNLSNAIEKRIIRLAWERINSSRKNLESVHVDQIITLCRNNRTGKKVVLKNDIEVLLSYDRLIFKKTGKKDYWPYSYYINMEGFTKVPELQAVLEAKVITGGNLSYMGDIEQVPENSLVQFFDLDKLDGEAVVRNRLAGDKIRPYKGAGEKKLKDFFIDKKIPGEKREMIPLVARGNRIIWIVGMRTSEDYRARKDTKNVLMLSWSYLKDGGDINA
ncbi:MAG: tRNA lysidine(34) synthetase TilS [Acetivibrionales bacterium]|jgi:tRNA(Ile)-lysidine synthase